MKLRISAVALLALAASTAQARDQINIVGSSTVYPFATVVAEKFGKTTAFKTPKIKSSNSSDGLRLFCSGVGANTPDITNASRKIKSKEIVTCARNGVSDITEAKIGYDGVVLANSKAATPMGLTLRDVFLALAREVPNPDGTESFVANPYTTWKEVNPGLPDTKIEVLGPSSTAGTRDTFAEFALEGGCRTFDWIKAMKWKDKKKYKSYCRSVREDGHYIETDEDKSLIVQKLVANPDALGVFGFNFLAQNADKVQGSIMDGVAPTSGTIAYGSYPVSRPLYLYIKNAHLDIIPGIREFVAEFMSDKASGAGGYLVKKGLIPMSADERGVYLPSVISFTPL